MKGILTLVALLTLVIATSNAQDGTKKKATKKQSTKASKTTEKGEDGTRLAKEVAKAAKLESKEEAKPEKKQ